MKATDKKIIEALQKNGGYVSMAAAALRVTHKAIYKRIEANPEIKAAWHEIKDKQLDLTENELLKQIRNGNLTAVIFYLKCQGKDRGWVEVSRHEVTGQDGGAVKVDNQKSDLSKLNKDELTELYRLHAKISGKTDDDTAA